MNKRFYLVLLLTIALTPLSFLHVNAAREIVSLELGYNDPNNNKDKDPKSPILFPEVSIDGNVLYFDSPCDGYTLQLINAYDNVVYSIVIPAGTTSLIFPSYLSGYFELQIIHNNLCFYGNIIL